MPVLITAASHAEAYKIERLLQLPDVIFADHGELPHLSFSGRKFIRIPQGNSASYAHELLTLALNSSIDRIIPLYADEVLPLAEARLLFAEYGISVLVPSLLWVKQHPHQGRNRLSEPVVIENGKVIAGQLPLGSVLPDENFSGVFQVESDEDIFVFKLFTV
jgi:hypothetical protein